MKLTQIPNVKIQIRRGYIYWFYIESCSWCCNCWRLFVCKLFKYCCLSRVVEPEQNNSKLSIWWRPQFSQQRQESLQICRITKLVTNFIVNQWTWIMETARVDHQLTWEQFDYVSTSQWKEQCWNVGIYTSKLISPINLLLNLNSSE